MPANFDAYTPHEAIINNFIQNQPDVFTLELQFTDSKIADNYSFQPGQFNMVYLYGVGEVAISIVRPENPVKGAFSHIIQAVGRITHGMNKLKVGEHIGIRGPFGSHWPIELSKDKDVLIFTGGLGNAPLMAAVEEILANPMDYKKLYVLHGIKSSDLLICEDMYQRWHNSLNTRVMMATSSKDPVDNGKWLWQRGFVTDLIPLLNIDVKNTMVMTVGPEAMMKSVAKSCIALGIDANNIFLSLERSMKCAIGHCGHCQLGPEFICKDGPVYAYSACKDLLEVEGL